MPRRFSSTPSRAWLVGAWDDAAADKAFIPTFFDAAAARLFGKGVDIERMKKLFALTAEARGACRVDRPVGGDGKKKAKVRLACDRYPVVLDFAFAEKDEKVESVRLMPLPYREGKCAL